MKAEMSDFLKLVGPIADFKPCARYSIGDVIVLTKDCSYTEKWVNPWMSVFWENHRPWYKPWNRCVGFKIYCPDKLGLTGDVLVTDVIDRVSLVARTWNAYGENEVRVYRLAKGLSVELQ